MATVVVALFSRLYLVVPFLLAWAFWGLIQRSSRAELRRVAWALAIPAALYVWKVGNLFFLHRSPGWAFLAASVLFFFLPLLWLYRRPSKAALWVQAAVSVLLLFVVIRMMPHLPSPAVTKEALASARSLVADAYFHVGSLGAALLALFRSQPTASPPGTLDEPVSPPPAS